MLPVLRDQSTGDGIALVARLVVCPLGVLPVGVGKRVVGEPLRVPLDVPRRSVPPGRPRYPRGRRGSPVRLVVVPEIPGEPVGGPPRDR